MDYFEDLSFRVNKPEGLDTKFWVYALCTTKTRQKLYYKDIEIVAQIIGGLCVSSLDFSENLNFTRYIIGKIFVGKKYS